MVEPKISTVCPVRRIRFQDGACANTYAFVRRADKLPPGWSAGTGNHWPGFHLGDDVYVWQTAGSIYMGIDNTEEAAYIPISAFSILLVVVSLQRRTHRRNLRHTPIAIRLRERRVHQLSRC